MSRLKAKQVHTCRNMTNISFKEQNGEKTLLINVCKLLHLQVLLTNTNDYSRVILRRKAFKEPEPYAGNRNEVELMLQHKLACTVLRGRKLPGCASGRKTSGITSNFSSELH